MKKFYITTPIYYVNDSPHIGHAYTSLACDVMARFMRLDGYDVKFLTGTDEHGQKVAKAAEQAGIDPKKFVDDVSGRFKELCKTMNYSNDDFIRTTEERHKKSAQELWMRIYHKGFIGISKYAGWYSVRDEAYYTEDELVLVDGKKKAPTGAEVEWMEEESYFFELSKFQDKLLKYYEENPDFIAPDTRRNEVISFVKQGLQDLSISRTRFNWGIPVPNDDKHVMYVWIDALANYLSAIGFPDENNPQWKLWPADLHMVGKDILRFHAVYWPAMLMAAELPLPKKIFAHGWWTVEGQKMSKSLGNVIAPADLVKEYGLDQSRYFLLREFPFGQDGNFARERIITVINSELANNIGNLCQRTLSMIHKNCDGVVPEYNKEFSDKDSVYITGINFEKIRDEIKNQNFQQLILDIVKYSTQANEYIDKRAPWKLSKEGKKEELGTVLYEIADSIRKIAILLQPFMPASAEKILNQLSVPKNEREFKCLTKEFSLKPGTKLGALAPVFPRFVDEKKAAS